MIVRSLVVLSVSLCSASTFAFQAKPELTSPMTQDQIRSVENTIVTNFYSGGHSAVQGVGTCAAVPVAGCNCPFCTMLRSRA